MTTTHRPTFEKRSSWHAKRRAIPVLVCLGRLAMQSPKVKIEDEAERGVSAFWSMCVLATIVFLYKRKTALRFHESSNRLFYILSHFLGCLQAFH
ncbi:hypothetical protein FHS56_000556 [Thermonema lapsum]|uniref:Uncharacterized protein n=1 Tax=Thermonema lapsum TaxID=28195 RepID=A0A846MNT7_9BACT|nr:hypothetical protein [Thermonema lapsum]NIK73070.1 hypothetical protein [Thermonema lapsum]